MIQLPRNAAGFRMSGRGLVIHQSSRSLVEGPVSSDWRTITATVDDNHICRIVLNYLPRIYL